MKTKSSYIPSYIVFSACLFILYSLGVWQLNKHYHVKKKNFYYSFSVKNKPLFIKSLKHKFKNYQFIEAKGFFLEDKAIFFEPRTYKGKVGFHKIVPFKIKDEYILVNRGFTQKKIIKSNDSDFIKIQGTIIKIPSPGFFSLKNDIQSKKWYTLDRVDVSQYLMLDISPYVLYEKKNDKNDYKDVLPNTISKVNHLQYAITWFLLALTMKTVFIIFLRGKNENM